MSESPPSDYERLCRVIGDLSLQWTGIEHTIQDICLHYASCVDEAFEGGRPAYDVLHVTLATMDMRQAVAAAKTIIFMWAKDRSPELYDRADKLLNYVDSTLRPERNRFIHDVWALPDIYGEHRGYTRLQLGPRVFSPQSRQRAYGTYAERHFATLEEVEKFTEVVALAQMDLNELDAYSAGIVNSAPLEEPPPPLPPEWKSLARRDWQGQSKPRPL